MKILKWIFNNGLFITTLLLLIVIPLYPKLPLLDVKNTWVYIRVEDFLVTFTLLFWFILLLFKKISLKTPLTLPILIFWAIGGISTFHGVLLLFPTLSDVFSNVAFLSLLRRMEYLSLFFVAFTSIKDKKMLPYIILTLTLVLLLVAGYGFGQKFSHFPAFLTMNEEFAKGIPIQLSALSRVPSTFAGHYDLAAYLVLVIPLLVSVAFGFKNWLIRIFLLTSTTLGFALLFLTVSRISLFVLLLSLVMLLILQRKKWVIVSLLAITLLFLSFSPSLLERFGNTVKEVDVLVDAKTGRSIGQAKEVPVSYFADKVVVRQFLSKEEAETATGSALIVPYKDLPSIADLVVEPNSPNGENLPQGTSYINLPLSPVIKKTRQYFYQKSDQASIESKEIRLFHGDFVIKKAKAYDLSFTTRFQGEWPKTIKAFKRNIFLGSGYGSVTLAVDNNYLRILGESGLFGFISFFSIFLVAFIYIGKILPKVDSPIVRSFALGFIAGTFGLALNAIFIDVFEASKVAFVYWMLMGITLGILQLYKTGEIEILKELKKVVTSSYAIVIYLLVAVWAIFSSVASFYFVGDDFTWFRWVADNSSNIIRYFTEANGFFYRPGTKVYFDLMYSTFWLNQMPYHFVSLILHFFATLLFSLIANRILKNRFLSVVTAVIFLMLSGHFEAIFWISSTGFLFNAVLALLGLFSFILWKEKRKKIYFILSAVCIILSLFFHEVGVIAPLLIILYDTIFGQGFAPSNLSRKVYSRILLLPIIPYLLLRFVAQSHWFSGDYSYNILKLPFNVVGNLVGYFGLSFFGPSSLSVYEKLRSFSRDHVIVAVLGSIILAFLFLAGYRFLLRKLITQEKKIITFGILFFIIALLPFLGLGNITSRYSYLPSVGFAILIVVFFKKTYEYFLGNGKHIAVLIVLLISIVFSSLHLFQSQKIQEDWHNAGEKSKNILTSLGYIYAHYSTEDTKQLYFVDVPIREGEAWVFPVGLSDAVQLVFRNDAITIHQVSSGEEAFNEMAGSLGRVFEFDSEGNVIELVQNKDGRVVRTGE